MGGIRPASVFKLVGAGQVGPGSIRSIPFLPQLRGAGFRVWPFDDARPPLAVEIWPRALTGPVVKRRQEERAAYLERFVPELAEPLRAPAAGSEHAFDAAVSAVVLARRLPGLVGLSADPEAALEGRIWPS